MVTDERLISVCQLHVLYSVQDTCIDSHLARNHKKSGSIQLLPILRAFDAGQAGSFKFLLL